MVYGLPHSQRGFTKPPNLYDDQHKAELLAQAEREAARLFDEFLQTRAEMRGKRDERKDE